MAKGDKRDVVSDLDIANFLHSKRSAKAQAVDNGTQARVTKNLGLWVAQPNRFDIIGVDTPKRTKKNPKIKSKAKGVIKKRFGVTVG